MLDPTTTTTPPTRTTSTTSTLSTPLSLEREREMKRDLMELNSMVHAVRAKEGRGERGVVCALCVLSLCLVSAYVFLVSLVCLTYVLSVCASVCA